MNVKRNSKEHYYIQVPFIVQKSKTIRISKFSYVTQYILFATSAERKKWKSKSYKDKTKKYNRNGTVHYHTRICKWLQWTTMLINTSFKWTIKTRFNYIFIKRSSHTWNWMLSMYINCDQYLHLPPTDFKKDHLCKSYKCWKSTVPNSICRVLTDSNLL